MAIMDAGGLPIAIHVNSALPHEVTLVEAILAHRFTGAEPDRLIGDKAYDSDGLDMGLAASGIEMIALNRSNRRKTQDGRPLRRYKRRWRVERLFARLHNFRRIVTR